MVRVLLASLSGLLLCACESARVPEPAERPSEPEAAAPTSEPGFVAPAWFPAVGHEDLAAVEGLDTPGPTRKDLRLRSPSVLVYDVDRGEILHEKAADQRRPIASVTKLFSALALVSEPVDLRDGVVCITPDHYPIKPGARSRMVTGSCYRGWDLVGAALVRSDNRAAMTFMTLAGEDLDRFVVRMDEVAREIGATDSSFQDPAGIGDFNLSTARDVTRAVIAAAAHPVVAIAASARTWHISTTDGTREHLLPTTNFLADRPGIEVLAAKTGYTDPARYCFAALVRTATGTRVAFALLGAEASSWRQSDALEILRWVEARDRAAADAVSGTADTR